MSSITLTDGGSGLADHGFLDGLLDDDHTQYLLDGVGRAGVQSLIGGLAAGDELDLAGTSDVGGGRVHSVSPFELEYSEGNTTPAEQVAFRWRPTFTTIGAYNGGMINAAQDVSYTNAFYIYALLSETGTYRAQVSAGFAAFTLFNALPRIVNDGNNVNLVQALVLNAAPQHERDSAGTSTTQQSIGLAFSPQTRATVSGAVMTKTAGDKAVTHRPTYSTVAGSTINFGTTCGLQAQNPGAGIFQPGAGVETMTAYRGVDVLAIPFGGNVDKVAFRSAIAAASNAYCLRNVGSAQSSLNDGNLLDAGIVQILSDSKSLSLGAAGGDVQIGWNGSELEFDPLVGPNLLLTPSAADHWVMTGSAALQGFGVNVETIVFGTTAPDPSTANFFVQFAAPNLRAPTVGGEYADVLWTAGGSIAVSGFAISNLDAYKINAVAYTLGGGSVADVSTLHVAAQSSDGIATRSHALRVQGRTRIDGHMNHGPATLAQLTASVTQLTLPANNGMRHVYLASADASGPWTIRGILNVQTADSFYIVNTSANAFLLGHQDGTAAAADRIISPTGASLTLGQDEMAKLWYDAAASRWRIFETTGA